MMYTVYDYFFLVEPFEEGKKSAGSSFFSTDPQAYLSVITPALNTSLPDLSQRDKKREVTKGCRI